MKDLIFKFFLRWGLIASLTLVSCSRIQIRDVSSAKETQSQIQLPILKLNVQSLGDLEKSERDKSKLRVVVQVPQEHITSAKKQGSANGQNIQFFPSMVEMVTLNQGQQTLKRGAYAIHLEARGLVATNAADKRLIAPLDPQGRLDWSQSLYECVAFRDSDGQFILELRHLFVHFRGLKIKENKKGVLPNSWLKKIAKNKPEENARSIVIDQGLAVKRIDHRFLLTPVEVLSKNNTLYTRARFEPFSQEQIAARSGSSFNITEKIRFFRVAANNSSTLSIIF